HIANSSGLEVSENIIHGTHAELVLFLVLNMWPSHFGLPVLLAIVLFSRRVQRHPTFINLLVVFMIVGIHHNDVNNALDSVYAGRASGAEPSHTLCLTQASLLYGMPGMYVQMLWSMISRIFIAIRAAFYNYPYREVEHIMRSRMMIIAPYAVWIVFIIATVLAGIREPAKVSRDRRFFYCSKQNCHLAAIVLFATFILEAWTIVLFYKRWATIERNARKLSTAFNIDFSVRILGFGVYVLIAMRCS
ncbi:hypothetical protein F5878DRAFT_676426, partial [Lentinula raphanica]